MKKHTLISLIVLLALLAGCATPTPAPNVEVPPTATTEPELGTEGFPWWNDVVFYEIFVRSFYDSDGDGIGDFNGITAKLDYLQDLGIGGLWLMPINPSPSYHGYDVTDYYAVNPQYGTMDDFKNLLAEAEKRDIKIIIDLVINHTSSRHPWFQKAQTPGSEYYSWYKWKDSDPGTLGPWGAPAWYKASNGQYYYAIFWDGMPDLNYDTPAVREEVNKITSFWLNNVGIDGFRLDAVRYLSEDQKLADADSNLAYLEEWNAYFRTQNPQVFTVGEVWTDNANVKKYTQTNTILNSAFNFDLSNAIIKALNESNNSGLRFVLQTTLRDFPEQDNSNFITNHDQPRIMNQFGADKIERNKVAASILLTAQGIPFLYYGEEIGMSGTKPDELIRTPMQWSAEEGAGFTTVKPWQAVNADYTEVNVAAQAGDANSLFEHYRALIQLRNEHPALRVGKTYVAESNSNKLVAYLRQSENETVLVLINIDDKPITDFTITLTTGPLTGEYTLTTLFGDAAFPNIQASEKGGFEKYAPIAELPPYRTYVIQLNK